MTEVEADEWYLFGTPASRPEEGEPLTDPRDPMTWTWPKDDRPSRYRLKEGSAKAKARTPAAKAKK